MVTINDDYLKHQSEEFEVLVNTTYTEIMRLGLTSPIRSIHFALEGKEGKGGYAPAVELKAQIGLFVDSLVARLTVANGTLSDLSKALLAVRDHFQGITDLNSASAEQFGRAMPGATKPTSADRH